MLSIEKREASQCIVGKIKTYLRLKILSKGGGSLSYSGFVPIVLLVITQMIINLINSGRKEALMEQLKKVKIVFKTVMVSTMQTLWAIGTSAVAGDVLKEFVF